MKNQIYPSLWFDSQAKAAAEFYCSIFPGSKILSDSGMVVNFELNGKHFMAFNGGDYCKFNEAVSFVIPCKDQDEIDYYWDKLVAGGGQEQQGGWCKDRFGLSWQVVPEKLGKMVSVDGKGNRVFEALMQMKKIDINTLEIA
jgi:predicted 3-demethylubiquinone-9 3-methyltransferase (glyoxalase superfamily)